MTGARIHVTKLAAAQRQLRASIRMFFSGEDELAIHTVASASYRIIADLKYSRGRDEVADYYLTSIFYAVRDCRRGTLPNHITDDPEAMQWVQDMAEQLPIKEDSRIEDVRVSVSLETARQYWLKRNRSSNFLKHADRDVHDHLSIDEINNLELLMLALTSYSDLVKDDLGAEGLILWIYFCATHGTKEHLPVKFQEMATKLGKLITEDQLEFCLAAIQELNASDT